MVERLFARVWGHIEDVVTYQLAGADDVVLTDRCDDRIMLF